MNDDAFLIAALMAAQQRRDPIGDAAALSSWPQQQTQPFQPAPSDPSAWQRMPRAQVEDRRNEVVFPDPQVSYGQAQGGMSAPGMLDEAPVLPTGRFNRNLHRDAVSENQLRYMQRTGHDGGNAIIDTPSFWAPRR